MTPEPDELIARALELIQAGRQVYGCLLTGATGSTPQSAGALMLVDDTTALHGTIGGGCIEAEVRRRAIAMLTNGERGRARFTLDHDYGWDDGLICGGSVEVAIAPLPDVDTLIELRAAQGRGEAVRLDLDLGDELCSVSLAPRPRLVIAGGGHVGQALARLGLPLGFAVTLVDDREDLLVAGAPSGALTEAGEIATVLAELELDGAYCVVVTRGHRHDLAALAAVVDRGAQYVGMIGSRRKVKLTLDALREQGVADDRIDAICAPIGLDIGAQTVEEIALSIAAQLVAVRRGREARGLSWRG